MHHHRQACRLCTWCGLCGHMCLPCPRSSLFVGSGSLAGTLSGVPAMVPPGCRLPPLPARPRPRPLPWRASPLPWRASHLTPGPVARPLQCWCSPVPVRAEAWEQGPTDHPTASGFLPRCRECVEGSGSACTAQPCVSRPCGPIPQPRDTRRWLVSYFAAACGCWLHDGPFCTNGVLRGGHQQHGGGSKEHLWRV